MSNNKLTIGNLDGKSAGPGGVDGVRIESGTGRFYGRRIEETVDAVGRPIDTNFETVGPPGPPGTNGRDGRSAYQIAVENGFIGTVQEWLTSLIGADGRSAYQIAVENGFVGTVQEWLVSLIGADGRSAYQIALENGFEGSESTWLASLVGPQGPQGPVGPQGPAGVDGIDGIDGVDGISMAAITEVPGSTSALSLDLINNYILFTADTPKSLTVHPESILAIPDNSEFYIRNSGLGDLVIVPGSGVIIDPPFQGTLIVPTGGTVTLKRIAVDTWDLFGQVVSDGSELELPPFSGQAGNYLAVNLQEDAPEWITPPTALDLLPTISGNANRRLAVNATATGLEWVDDLVGTPYTDEQVRDVIGTTLVAGSNVSLIVDDAGDIITINATASASYPTFAGNAGRILAVNATEDGVEWVAAGVSISDGDKGDITVSSAGSVWTVDNGAITLAKMANLAANSFIGNNTASPATPVALSAAQAKTLLSLTKADVGLANVDDTSDLNKPISTATQTALDLKANLTGAVFTGAISASNLSGNNTGDENYSSIITKLSGGSGGGTTNFLRADGVFAPPPGSGAAVAIEDEGIELVAAASRLNFTGSAVTVTDSGAGEVQINIAGGSITDGDKGDITVSGTGSTWTVDTNAITLEKLSQVDTGTFLGRITTATGNVEALTATQATSLLNTFTLTEKGLVPPPSTATGKFLKDDGTWVEIVTGATTVSLPIINPSFENGSTGWTLNNFTVTGANPPSHNATPRTGSAMIVANAVANAFATQVVVVDAAWYDGIDAGTAQGTFTAFATQTFTNPERARLTVSFLDVSDVNLGGSLVTSVSNDTEGNVWEILQVTGPIPTTTRKIRYELRAERLDGTNNNIAFDDVSGSLTLAIDALTDAPSDGTLYGRRDGMWTEIPAVADGDKGDITVSGSGSTWSIDNGAVTLAKLDNLPANTLIGNNTASSAVPVALGSAQVTALLDTFTLSNKGLVPAPATSSGNFLRDDGTWAPISVSGGGGNTTSWTVTAIGTGSPQDIILPEADLVVTNVLVFINGLRFESDEYSIVGDTLTITSNSIGDSIEIVKYSISGSLDNLSDVDVSTIPPLNNQALVWNEVGALWVPGSPSGTVVVEDEGTTVVTAASRLNFAGAGVVVSDAGSGEATVTISGASAPSQTVTVSGTSANLDNADAGKYQRWTNSGAKTLNVRANATHAITQDAEFYIANRGTTGALTIAPAGGVTINLPLGGTPVLDPGMVATLKRVAENEFDLIGQVVLA